MNIYTGTSINNEIAIGKIFVYINDDFKIEKRHVKDTDGEIKRLKDAINKAISELESLYERASDKTSLDNADIFNAHIMILKDDSFAGFAMNIISSENVNAEYAINNTKIHFMEMFTNMEDEYFKNRVFDIKDVTDRVLSALTGKKKNKIELDEPVILVAENLTPSETLLLDKNKILAFVLTNGSINSHSSILAKSMNIPALIGTDINLKSNTINDINGINDVNDVNGIKCINDINDINGKTAVVDGFEGKLYIEPDEIILKEKNRRIEENKKEMERLLNLKGKGNITKSGRKIDVYANAMNLSDIDLALFNDAGGIGLFRSEFIFLESNDYPTEDEQFLIYKDILEKMEEKEVIIRTLDLGADKQTDYLGLDEEENPALGLRGIRICLKNKKLFKTQLRALFRASVFGNLSIMYPMIISIEEVKEIKEVVNEVKSELDKENIKYSENIKHGIMVETPAAVMISDELAKEVDFFSVGTNDLTQYTLAIDRGNTKLDKFYNPYHEAILRMLKIVADNAHKNNIRAAICGELGSDIDFLDKILEIGYDEISIAPGKILKIREKIRSMK